MAAMSENDNCGSQRALAKLTNHIATDHTKSQEKWKHNSMHSNDLVLNPSSFNLNSLLHEINSSDNNSTGWTGDFLQSLSSSTQNVLPIRSQWHAEFSLKNDQLSQRHPSTSQTSVLPQSGNLTMPPYSYLFSSPTSHESNWAANYLDMHSTKLVDESVFDVPSNQEMITEIITDSNKQSECQDDELTRQLHESRQKTRPNSTEDEQEMWSNIFNSMVAGLDTALEFVSASNQDNSGQNPVTMPHLRQQNSPVYEFESDILPASAEDSYNEGLRLFAEGRVPESILAFEAAVKKEPNFAKAWQKLAVSLSENEQENKAQTACGKCLKLDPHNSEALLSLARNYANDLNRVAALKTLRDWLTSQPDYRSIVDTLSQREMFRWELEDDIYGMFISREDFNNVENLLLHACNVNPTRVDPDLQCALGILYHMDAQFSKAIDCFQTALQVRPNDAFLWNKLGATLANSDQDAQAIEAYRRALELAPGFVRARCNLGIACITLRAYKEALDHGVEALLLQSRAFKESSQTKATSQTSDASIWHLIDVATRRLSANLPNQLQFLSAVEQRDMNSLMSLYEANRPQIQ